jgi:hypothetical protein
MLLIDLTWTIQADREREFRDAALRREARTAKSAPGASSAAGASSAVGRRSTARPQAGSPA